MRSRTGLLALALVLAISASPALSASTDDRHAASSRADRIILTPGANPASEMAVAYRTDARQTVTQVELASATAGPNLPAAQLVTGQGTRLATESGEAYYHHARFTGLTPDHPYVYRVRGAGGWSEWLPFRTAASAFRSFRFIYLGDAQNDILDHGSRVVRQALQNAGPAALVLHAGDLVDKRATPQDQGWGEWTEAGGYGFSTVPQLPAPGNHEYLDFDPSGRPGLTLAPHWRAQFALPQNGADDLRETTYFVDYQGVRFVVLDGTAALDLGRIESQTAWAERILAAPGPRWKVVMFHQPVFSCARAVDAAPLTASWAPLFERQGVDLVLQGHDHCYARVSKPEDGQPVAQGPVYVVSVAGGKMNPLSARAAGRSDSTAQDTQLYQVIEVEADVLKFRAFNAVSAMHDAFDLVRDANGQKRVVEVEIPLNR